MPRIQNTDEAFKKTNVVVGHPGVAEENINDEYYRNPPHNVEGGPTKSDVPGAKTGEKHPIETGAPPDAELGRVKKVDELAEIATEESVHP